MNTKTLLFLALALFSTSALSAEMAKIIRMTGTQDVVVTLPDGSSIAGSAGLEMPVDSLIEVNAGTRLFFKTFEGQITVVEPDSVIFLETIEVTTAGKEKTVVELKSGNLVANLDPTKRGTNDYGVRTPKGVAAARGTNYTVSVNGQNVVVTVVAGVVSINIPDVGGAGGVTTVALISPGEASADGGAAQTIASVLTTSATSTPAQVAAAATTRIALQAAAAVVATLAQSGADGVTNETLAAVVGVASKAASDSGDNGLVALVAATATQANPSQAAAIVTAAVTAAPAAATTIVASVTQEVVQSEGASSDAAATAAALSTVANEAPNATVTVDPVAVTTAVTTPAAPTTTTTDATGNTTETETVTTEDAPVEVVIEVPTDNIVISPSS